MEREDLSVLVTSADSKQALAVVRSLSKLGVDVSAAGAPRFSQSFYSKRCSQTYRYTDPKIDITQFISDLKSITKTQHFDVLLPIRAATTVPIAKYQEEFEHVNIPIDTYQNIELAHNKRKTFEHAENCGVPIPATYCPENTDELRSIADRIEYPAVIKLRKTAASRGLRYVHSRDDLLEEYRREGPEKMSLDYSNPLIQEYVSGDIHDVCVLFRNGELKKALTQKRIRMFPKSGGAGVVNVTTERPDLIEFARDLLSPIEWSGVAQIEFMDGPELDDPKLIEINPKIWGTTELSIAAGMNFPRYLCDLAVDQEIQGPQTEYRRGLHFIWYEGGLIGNIVQSEGIVKPIKDICEIQRADCRSNINFDDLFPHLIRLPQIGIDGVNYLRKNEV
jgi:predicted ATP-grasp superfamily ATP-dependent carboligase